MRRYYDKLMLGLISTILAVFLVAGVARAEEGQFGAEFATVIGAQVGPFKTGAGPYVGGEIGLPLMVLAQDTPAYGKLMGLIHLGWSQTSDNVSFEPSVNAVAPGALPTQGSVDLNTLSIIIGLKYKSLYNPIVQPFVLAGVGFNAFFNKSDPGNQIGGVISQPEKLQDRGFPSGQGNVEPGFHTGAGIDINVTRSIFVGAEGRFNYVNRNNGSFGTFGGRLGFRF